MNYRTRTLWLPGLATLLAAPGAAWLMQQTGSWLPVFYVAVAMDVCAAALAWFWLKPLVARRLSAEAAGAKVQHVAAD